MSCDSFRDASLWNSRTTDNQRNVDVRLITTFFSGLQPVLANMVSVVSRVEDVGIVQQAVLFELVDQSINKLVNSLERTKTTSVVLIVVFHILITQLRLATNPVSAGRLVRVEILRARHLGVGEKLLVSLGSLWNTGPELVVGNGNVIVRSLYRKKDARVHVAVWGDGSYGQEERLASFNSIIEKFICLLSNEVG